MFVDCSLHYIYNYFLLQIIYILLLQVFILSIYSQLRNQTEKAIICRTTFDIRKQVHKCAKKFLETMLTIYYILNFISSFNLF